MYQIVFFFQNYLVKGILCHEIMTFEYLKNLFDINVTDSNITSEIKNGNA